MAGQGLAGCINGPGGMTIAEACSRAKDHLDVIEARALDTFGQAVQAIVELSGSASADPQARAEMHRQSCTIAGLGGMFKRDTLGKAAYSLCRLLDETEPGWSAEGVALHVDALRLLLDPANVPDGVQAQLVEGLVKVRQRLARERGSLPPPSQSGQDVAP